MQTAIDAYSALLSESIKKKIYSPIKERD